MAGKVSLPRVIRLVYERRRRGWSQATVGTLVRTVGGLHRVIKQSNVSALERGRLIPTERELAAFARLYDVQPPAVLLDLVAIDPYQQQSSTAGAEQSQ